jgi:hypothetical protein
MPTTELAFARGDKGAAQIQSAIATILSDLNDPASETSKAAKDAGIDTSEFVDAAVDVKESAQGAEPILTAIIISITAKVAGDAVSAFWKRVLWPRLIPLIGVRGVGAEQSQEDAPRETG